MEVADRNGNITGYIVRDAENNNTLATVNKPDVFAADMLLPCGHVILKISAINSAGESLVPSQWVIQADQCSGKSLENCIFIGRRLFLFDFFYHVLD